jgi:hypothetical protein
MEETTMSCKKMLIMCCAATITLVGCECVKGPQGKYDDSVSGVKHRISLAADGTVIGIETEVGGNYEEATPTPDDAGEGTKILDIKVYEHDGSLTGLKNEDGTADGQETHPHTGGQNPPWNSHCHRVFWVGTQKFTTHC